MPVDRCHIKSRKAIPTAVQFAKELAKKYGLKDITNHRRVRYKYKVVIGVGERYWGRGHITVATDNVENVGKFMTQYANELWTEYRIMNEWGDPIRRKRE